MNEVGVGEVGVWMNMNEYEWMNEVGVWMNEWKNG